MTSRAIMLAAAIAAVLSMTSNAIAVQRPMQALGCGWDHLTIAAGSGQLRSAGVNLELARFAQSRLNSGDEIGAMAITPDCNGGLIVMSSGAYIGRNLNLGAAKPVYRALDALKRTGRRIEGVAFDPFRWSSSRRFVIIHDGGYFAGGLGGGQSDTALLKALEDAADNRGGVSAVAFAPHGKDAGASPSGWAVAARDGHVVTRGVGGEAPTFFNVVGQASSRRDIFVSFAPDRTAPFYRWSFGKGDCHQGSGPRIAFVAAPECVDLDPVEKIWRGVETELRLSLGVESAADLLDRHKAAGATIAMISAGRTPVIRHYGLRNLKRGLKTDSDTLYPASSMTKMVAGLTFAIADAKGELSLSRTIESIATAKPEGIIDRWRKKVFTGRRARRNNWTDWPRRIDLGHLLRHRAALDTWGLGSSLGSNRCRSLEALILGRKTGFSCNGVRPLNTLVPGQAMQYSGGGYLVAEASYMQITGRSLRQDAERRVLRPAGMTRSFFWGADTDDIAIARGCRSVRRCPDRLLTNQIGSATGLVTHPEDFARLVQILMMDGWDGHSVPRQVFTLRHLNRLFSNSGGIGYGLGVWYTPAAAAGYANVVNFQHGGTDTQGFKSGFIANRNQHKAIVYFINGTHKWDLNAPEDRGNSVMAGELERAFNAYLARVN